MASCISSSGRGECVYVQHDRRSNSLGSYSERCATWEAPDAHIEPLLITFHDAAREEGHDPDLVRESGRPCCHELTVPQHFDFFLEKAESANGPWKYQ
jgi:hypothetical protein